MAGRFLLPRATAFDENGNPISGAKLEFFESGTTTQQATYSDDALTVPNTNPVIADSAGRFGDIFLLAADYKVTLSDANDVVIWTADPVRSQAPKSTVVVSVTTTTQLTVANDGNLIAADATAGAFIVTLPAAATAGDGYEVTVMKVDSSANIVTVDGSGAETINGVADLNLPDQYSSAVFRTDGTQWYASAVTQTTESRILPPDFLDDFTISISSGDAEHDVDVAPGTARSDEDNGNIILSSTITKQIDAAFAEGTNQGGLDTGTVAADTKYFVWAIAKPAGTADALFSLSNTAPTLPSGFTLKRRIGDVFTDSSSNLDGRVGQVLNTGNEKVSISITANMANFGLSWDNAEGWRRVEILFSNLAPDVDSGLFLRTSSDGGATYDSGASDYQYRTSLFTTGIATVVSGGAAQILLTGTGTSGLSATAGEEAEGIINIILPAKTTANVGVQGELSAIAGGGSLINFSGRGSRLADADVDGAQLLFDGSNNIARAEIEVYFHK